MPPLLVTGGTGFLGQAIRRWLPEGRYLSSADLDLTDGAAVGDAFADWRPEVVVHLAARVGGITANLSRQADFLIDNIRIDGNVLAAVRARPPRHFIPMLSTCMYPDRLPDTAYPMSEDQLEDGPPPPSNAAYAAAKRALWHGVEALHEQHGMRYSALVPSNLYGPGDHFGDANSHFLAAAIHKLETARTGGADRVEFMGTGSALRQFLYVDDLARLVARLVDEGPLDATVNVAPGWNRSISSLALAAADAVGYAGDVVFTGEGPDGQYRKDVETRRLQALVTGWSAMETSLEDGLKQTVEWYRGHVATR